MVEETFFHLFNLIVVNAHINKKKMLLEIVYEQVAEGSLASGNSSARSD